MLKVNIIDLLAKEEIQINITKLEKELSEINKKRDKCNKDILGFKIMIDNFYREAADLDREVQKYKEWARRATIFTKWFWKGKADGYVFQLLEQNKIINFYHRESMKFENQYNFLNKKAREIEDKIKIYQTLLQS
ncbi:hypothetical protein RF11_01603 [Thelohanellus kitauei]|uniref:Uncharacterized protein n=1 Tax=Thelohanellus kitauei TaxID=669202 RepID=A0A0C2N5X2_THEKT|nr:hypothetical protein RF11_01603 [Thelohanellus kitauei]